MAHAKLRSHSDDTDRLREDVAQLRADFAALARELAAYAGHEARAMSDRTGEEALEKLGNRVVALKETGAHHLERARRYAAEAERVAETTLREHPGYAVAGAAALGFLVGALTLRRR